MSDPLHIDDEILLEDSDEDFQRKGSRITRSNSKKQLGRKSLNNSELSVRDVEDEILQGSKSKERFDASKNARSAFAAKVKSKLIDENKVKNILSGLNKGSNQSVSRSQSTPASSRNPISKKKLTDSWKKAQNQRTPTKSSKVTIRRVFDVDSDPEDDFKPSSASRRLTRNSSKVSLNESVLNGTKSGDSSIISLEDDEESELENELSKVEKLKIEFDKKLASINKKGTKISKVVIPPIKKTTSTPKVLTSTKVPIGLKNKSMSEIKGKVSKPALIPITKKIRVPKVIETGPIDCFDDLIVKTDLGYPCNFCDQKLMFKKRREMIDHLQLDHNEELSEEQRNRELAGVFTCDVCQSVFCSKHILRTHRKAHDKVKDNKVCDVYYKFYLNIRTI